MADYGVAVVGASGVGKSALCSRLVAHRFNPAHKVTHTTTPYTLRHQTAREDCVVVLEDTPPIGTVAIKELVKPRLWFEDTPPENPQEDQQALLGDGNARHDELPPRHGFVVVFDLGSLSSFEQAREAIHELVVGRLAFAVQGWKKIPVVILVVGNKCETIGKKRQVTPAHISALIADYTHEALLDRSTKANRVHLRYLEVSTLLGTNCEAVLPTFFAMLRKLPSKQEALARDMRDGWYGGVLKKFEIARVMHAHGEDAAVVARRVSRRVSRTLGPVFSLRWVDTAVEPVTRLVPRQFKVFPRWMVCCLCCRQPAAPQHSHRDDDEDEDFSDAQSSE